MNSEMMMNIAGAIKFTLKYMTAGAIIFTALCVIIGLVEVWGRRKDEHAMRVYLDIQIEEYIRRYEKQRQSNFNQNDRAGLAEDKTHF